MGKPRDKARPRGVDGHLWELSKLGRVLPDGADLSEVVGWVVRLEDDIDFSYGELRLSPRQRTAVTFLLDHAFSLVTDDVLTGKANALFHRLEEVRRRGRVDFVEKVLRRMGLVARLEQRAHGALGRSAEEGGRWEDARSAYQRAWEACCAAGPGDVELGARLAWAEIKLGDLDSAVRLLEELTHTNPDDPRVAELLRIARSPSARA